MSLHGIFSRRHPACGASPLTVFASLVVLSVSTLFLSAQPAKVSGKGAAGRSATEAAFVEGARAAGLTAFHLSAGGERDKRYILEAMSGGVCVLDYDGDGYMDLYFVNGGDIDAFRAGKPSGLRNMLFRNQHDGTFKDVTAQAGVG